MMRSMSWSPAVLQLHPLLNPLKVVVSYFYIHGYLTLTDIPKGLPVAQKAALKTFNKYCAVIQNYVDPKVMNPLFVKQGVLLGGVFPITGPAEELQLRVQMKYMLGNIRKHIGAKNAEVFYGLIYAFQTVSDYHNHLEG